VRDAHATLAQSAVTVEQALALALAPAPATVSKWIDRDAPPGLPNS
jgi:hypothetical protein